MEDGGAVTRPAPTGESSVRQRHSIPLRPRREHGQHAGIELHAVLERGGATLEAAFARQAHALHPRTRRRGAAERGEVRGFAFEILRATEQGGVEHLEENRCSLALRRVGAAVAGESARERLHQQAEGVTLVAVVESADGQQRGGETKQVGRGGARGHRGE